MVTSLLVSFHFLLPSLLRRIVSYVLWRQLLSSIYIPNRTFLARFGGISGDFGRAMVRILARCSRAKIPMVRLNEPDMLPKRTTFIERLMRQLMFCSMQHTWWHTLPVSHYPDVQFYILRYHLNPFQRGPSSPLLHTVKLNVFMLVCLSDF